MTIAKLDVDVDVDVDVDQNQDPLLNVFNHGETYYSPAIIIDGAIKLVISNKDPCKTFKEAEDQIPSALEFFESNIANIAIIEYKVNVDTDNCIEIIKILTLRNIH
jgi:hypothetical protein